MKAASATTPLDVVGFVSGSPLSLAGMARIAREHRLRAVVLSRAHVGRLARLRVAFALARLGVRVVDPDAVERLRPDVIVSWSYPRKIAAQTVAAAHIGALNMHMALLPRHRGLDPIFWTYWHDDRDAGVTIHWMNERFDSGDVISQEAVPLERGLASRELYDRIAPRSLGLMTSALAAIAAGTAARQPQDESRATFESAADTRRVRVPLAEWPAERVWHVLSGLGDMRSGLVSDAVDHGRATRYHLTANVEPGRVVAVAGGYDLHCRDGIVALSRRN